MEFNFIEFIPWLVTAVLVALSIIAKSKKKLAQTGPSDIEPVISVSVDVADGNGTTLSLLNDALLNHGYKTVKFDTSKKTLILDSNKT